MWANFISHCDEGAIFHNSRSELFHIRRKPNISLKAYASEVFRIFADTFRAFRVCTQIRTAKPSGRSVNARGRPQVAPTHSKFIYKAIDATAFWTDSDWRKS